MATKQITKCDFCEAVQDDEDTSCWNCGNKTLKLVDVEEDPIPDSI